MIYRNQIKFSFIIVRRLLVLLGLTVAICNGSLAQSAYGIAPLERSVAALTGYVATDKAITIPVYCVERSKTTVQNDAPESKKRKKKTKKKNTETTIVKQVTVTAKKTSVGYDPNEVLRDGFTVTMWVFPQTEQPEGNGYILFPVSGTENNGVLQSQWGITIDNRHIRVYERLENERMLLEYSHECTETFFVTLTCRDATPMLYINGELVSTGIRSGCFPHPALEGMSHCPESKKFVGEYIMLHYFAEVLSNADIRGLYVTEYRLLHSENHSYDNNTP